MKIVFMGTPEFAVPSLAEILAAGHDVLKVYTQPPRPAGRGKSVTKSPVHTFAEIMGLSVDTPDSFRKSKVIDGLEGLGADVACVVAYGQILPKRALEAPAHGCLNLHASALPRWRGAAPIQRAIMAGDTQTAVQIIQMQAALDAGPILLSETVAIKDSDTAGSLHDRLAPIGASLWPRALAALERGGLQPTPQVGEPVYAHKIEKFEARLDWDRPAKVLADQVRGLSPFPGAWCTINEKRIKVHFAKAEPRADNRADLSPGTALDDDLLIACGMDALRLTSLQPSGKGVMSAHDFLRGNPVSKGTVLS